MNEEKLWIRKSEEEEKREKTKENNNWKLCKIYL